MLRLPRASAHREACRATLRSHRSCIPHPHEVGHECVTFRRQDALGMKLHPLERQRPMAHGHDLALGSLRAQFQLCRKRSPFHAKRMIPAGFEWLRQAVENAAVIMSHERCLAMHQSLGAYDVAPEITYEALVPQ